MQMLIKEINITQQSAYIMWERPKSENLVYDNWKRANLVFPYFR
jgi:hypothetical protein